MQQRLDANRITSFLKALLRERAAVTLLAVLSVVFLAISLAIRTPELQAFDIQVTRWVQQWRSPLSDVAFALLTEAGSTLWLAIAASAVGFVLLRASRPIAALLCVVATATVLLNLMVKPFFGRPRPTADVVEVIIPALGLSYPSGHSMASVAVFGIIAVMIWIHVRPVLPRVVGTAGAGLLALGIGVSRIYVGAHWFSDVIGGWTAGALCLMLLTMFYRQVGKRELGRLRSGPPLQSEKDAAGAISA